MTFEAAVRSVLGQYAGFGGRARRSEYWFWTLAVLIAYVVTAIVSAIVRPLGLVLLFALIVVAFVPGLAVSVRRLHDTGRSGAWIFIALVPFVGGIILLVFYCMDSQPQANQYGPSPKDGGFGYGASPAT